jgi:hypothetical protein
MRTQPADRLPDPLDPRTATSTSACAKSSVRNESVAMTQQSDSQALRRSRGRVRTEFHIPLYKSEIGLERGGGIRTHEAHYDAQRFSRPGWTGPGDLTGAKARIAAGSPSRLLRADRVSRIKCAPHRCRFGRKATARARPGRRTAKTRALLASDISRRSSVRRSERRSGPPLRTREPRGTALVPTATSNVSRSPTPWDDRDAGDAPGHIYTPSRSAGGRKVAGSNPVAPTTTPSATGAASRGP